MLELKNTTPLKALHYVLPGRDGRDTVHVVCKGSFNIAPHATWTDEPLAIQEEDSYWGDVGKSSIHYGSDISLGKSATDIIIHGMVRSAHPTPALELNVQVGQLTRSLTVMGERQWQGQQPSHPLPFSEMPLIFERCYGGTLNHVNADGEEESHVYELNPVGVGYIPDVILDEGEAALKKISLPNIEGGEGLLRSPKHTSLPSLPAYISSSWMPRRKFAGTYDDQWLKERAPYLPLDFNPKFNSQVGDDWIYPGFLQGNESVAFNNIGLPLLQEFRLPHLQVAPSFWVNGGKHKTLANLETLLIEPDFNRFSCVWHSTFQYEGRLADIQWIDIELEKLNGASKGI